MMGTEVLELWRSTGGSTFLAALTVILAVLFPALAYKPYLTSSDNGARRH